MTNKERLFQTALALFAQDGYDRTTTSAIARATGVSEGLLFRHYGSKAGLLEALLREGLAQIAASMQGYTAAADPQAAIPEHIDRSGQLLRQHRTFWSMVHRLRFQPEVEQTAGPLIVEVNSFIISNLTENFRRLGASDPVGEAMLLFAAIDGIAIHFVQQPDTYPLEAILKILKNKY